MSHALRLSQTEFDQLQARHRPVVVPKPVVKPKAVIPKPDGDAALFGWQLNAAGLPHEREWRFHDKRKWRFDYAFPAAKLAVEIDGGLFVDGGHSRGRARIGDMERDVEANLLGWLVVRMPPEWVKPGKALKYVEQLLRARA